MRTRLIDFPCCGKTRYFRLWFIERTTKGLRVSKRYFCRKCGTIRLSDHAQSSIAEIYSDNSFSETRREGKEPNARMQEQRFHRAHRRLRMYVSAGLRLPSGSRALEIGCSTGQFLRALSESGVEAEGIEPSKGFATAGKKEGFTIHEGFYPEVDAIKGNSYETVFFIHSLEHIPDCGSVLAEIYDQLAVGGQLLVEVPCYEIALHDRNWLGRGYFHDAHLFDFTRQGLNSMLRRHGFVIENEGIGDGNRPKNWFVIATRGECRNPGATPFLTGEDSSFISLWSYLKTVRKMFPIQGV